MRRKRSRRRLRPAPVLWLLVSVNVCAALFASRLTALRHLEVFGVRPYDEPRLRAILVRLQGIPHARINPRQVETEVMREPSVRYAEFSTNYLGKGNMRIVYRRPVARLVGPPHLAVDADGVVYRAPDLPADLPWIQLVDGGPPTLVGLAGNWQARRLAELAENARTLGPPQSVGIQVDRGGAICLNIGSGRVMLGSCDDLDRKLKVLRERLQKNHDALSQVEELILTRPDAPAVVKKKQVPPP